MRRAALVFAAAVLQQAPAAVQAMATTAGTVPKRVAVIGGGAAGLITSKVLRDAGLSVKLFERRSGVGGVWRYGDANAPTPMYHSLVTNLPKQIMSVVELPFPAEVNSYLTHSEVQQYLEAFATRNNLWPLIQLNARVDSVAPKPQSGWTLQHSSSSSSSSSTTEEFDFIAVCNGHYDAPSSAPLPGLAQYTGAVVYAKDYDQPQAFADRRVLCVGARASGTDIAREVSGCASTVHVCDRSVQQSSLGGERGNIWRRPSIVNFSGGKVLFGVHVTFFLLRYLLLCCWQRQYVRHMYCKEVALVMLVQCITLSHDYTGCASGH
jgi:cation diffusion facilitator CzcD-associated flavoprotein CzcO